ncbi:MAG TPA: hypothetical protein VNA13_02970 [Xanthomonadales bacterium]|nr:hypothetical protein [Xanthomonadales bacterium]
MRTPILENDQVKVWKTVIHKSKKLPFHRHDSFRIAIPLTDACLRYVYEGKNETKLNVWKKGQAYWLEPNPKGEMHGYINESENDIEVIVVELKSKSLLK